MLCDICEISLGTMRTRRIGIAAGPAIYLAGAKTGRAAFGKRRTQGCVCPSPFCLARAVRKLVDDEGE
eukprot:11164186-Lingulodinium_polyedra.AAC.1